MGSEPTSARQMHARSVESSLYNQVYHPLYMRLCGVVVSYVRVSELKSGVRFPVKTLGVVVGNPR